jgi:hypothetical protein
VTPSRPQRSVGTIRFASQLFELFAAQTLGYDPAGIGKKGFGRPALIA